MEHHRHRHLPPPPHLPSRPYLLHQRQPPPLPPPPTSSNHYRHEFRHVDDVPRVSPLIYDDRRRFEFREPPPPISPIMNRQVNPHRYYSPTPPPLPFVNHVDRFRNDDRSSRFTEDFDVDSRFRFRFDNGGRIFDEINRNDVRAPRLTEEFDVDSRMRLPHFNEVDRRDFSVIDRDELRRNEIYDDWRSMNDCGREEQLRRPRNMVSRDELGRETVYDDWRDPRNMVCRDELGRDVIYDNRRGMNDFEREEELHRHWDAVARRDELVYDTSDVKRRIVNNRMTRLGRGLYHSDINYGEVVGKVGGLFRDENARGDGVHTPVEFRGRELEEGEWCPELYEEQISRELYVDRGRRVRETERERVREDMRECYDHNPWNNSSRNQSAFHKLQPAIRHTSTSKNRLDNTTRSPQKGKGIEVDSLGHRSKKRRVRSSVELNGSLKSKAIIGNPSSPKADKQQQQQQQQQRQSELSSMVDDNEKVGTSYLNTGIHGKSPLNGPHSRIHGINSPIPNKKETQSEVWVSPILMKVGIRKVAELPDNSPKSSSTGCSSLSGSGNTCCMASGDGEVLSKDDKRAGFCKTRASSRMKRKAVNLISRLSSVPTNEDTEVDVGDSSSDPSGGSMPDAVGAHKPGYVQDEQQLSNLDACLTISPDKCGSDIDAKKGGRLDQESLKLEVASAGDDVVNTDLCCERMHSHDSLATISSVTCDVDTSILAENRAYSARSDVNGNEPRGLSPECDTIGQQYRGVHIDDDDNDNEANLRDTGGIMKLGYSPSIDVSNGDNLSTDCMKITTICDIDVSDGIKEQQRTGASSILVNDEARKRRRLSHNACESIGSNLGTPALSSVGNDIFLLGRKRKEGIKVADVDPKDFPCSCTKKRNNIPFDPIFNTSTVSQSCNLCASAHALKSIACGSLFSVDHSEQSRSGFELSNSLLPPEVMAGVATNSLQTVISVSGDSSKVELQHKNSQGVSGSSYTLEFGWDSKGDDNPIGARNCLGNVSIGSDSEYEVANNYRDSVVHCVQRNHIGDTKNEPRIYDNMEHASNVTLDGNLAIRADSPFLCNESTQDIVTSKPVIMSDKSYKGNSLGVFSPATSTFGISSPAIHTASNDASCRDDKESGASKFLEAFFSQRNLVHGGLHKNLKPGNSAAPSNHVFTAKAASVPPKYTKKAMPLSSSVNRQFSWRNELTRSKTTTSSQGSPVTMLPKRNLVGLPAKRQTWHRTDNQISVQDTTVKKPSSSLIPPQRPPYGKTVKVQDSSYVRKGNSLVRNSALSTTAVGPCAPGPSITQGKPITINSVGKVKFSGTTNSILSPDRLIVGGQHASVEILERHSSPCSERSSDCDILYEGDGRSPLQVEQFEGMDKRVAIKATETSFSLPGSPDIVLDQNLDDAGNVSNGILQALNVKRVVYIKRKANQLIAASTPPVTSGLNVDKNIGISSENNYYKRRRNQLIRASSESNIQKIISAADDNSSLQSRRAFNVYRGRSDSKLPSSRGVKSLKVSLVWKLGDAKPSNKGSEPLKSRQLLSHLLPWKRTTYRRTVCRASASSVASFSSIKSRKLLSSKNQAVLYMRSGRGFSLRRSKVVSLGGSLKWSKSMEKRSKKVEEEAALAVATSDSTANRKTGASGVRVESGIRKVSSHKSVHVGKQHRGERIFRVGESKYRMDASRRTLQRIPDVDGYAFHYNLSGTTVVYRLPSNPVWEARPVGRLFHICNYDEEASDSTTKTEEPAQKSFMPKRLLIGSDEYVRIGNGHQLVRDPKRRTRILASEKVRWSLHTARLRLAKKRKFCQFFTRFGRCNKSEGKCPYIHDSSKINVCTKFLKGLCTDPNCKLTHKIIPDRMPDCSFYLQGLCSNESCPYRHVNANPHASICESFLRGYCAEGSKCQKKHSYLCPEFEATGSCPQGSKCKLYHPKKGMSKKEKISEDQRSIRGRYFDPGLTIAEDEPESGTVIPEKNSGVVSEGGDLGDYISLDVSDDELGENIYPKSEAIYLPEFDPPRNNGLLSGGDFGDYINLDNEAEENKYTNREVTYLSEFDGLNSLSEDV